MTDTISEVASDDLDTQPLDALLAIRSQMKVLAPDVTFSDYQLAIFDFVLNGRGNGIVNAVAGSGKSFTLTWAARLVKGVALFVAFSKDIQLALEQKLRGTSMMTKTVHSIGYGAVIKEITRYQAEIGNPNARLKSPDSNKYRNLAKRWVEGNQAVQADIMEIVKAGRPIPDAVYLLTQLVDKARVTLTDPHDYPALMSMADRFAIDVDELNNLYAGVAPVLSDGEYDAKNNCLIDFTDMIWLPYRWNLTVPTYNWVFVDECQDLSACQLHLVMKCLGAGGRMLAVGDPYQAIYGFAGADQRSFWRIKELNAAQELPLSICYRCPSSHIEAVRKRGTVKTIEARPDAPAGELNFIKDKELYNLVREGDMILCRTNAPLVRCAAELIAKRVPARVKGRDIGKEISGLAKKVAERCNNIDKFIECLDKYVSREVERLSKRPGNENKIGALYDKSECVAIVYETSKVNSVEALCGEIEALFSDDRASVTCSSVHRAKGLENERIFVIHPEELPLIWANQLDWQYDQEKNLEYVAMTRATQSLVFVSTSKES